MGKVNWRMILPFGYIVYCCVNTCTLITTWAALDFWNVLLTGILALINNNITMTGILFYENVFCRKCASWDLCNEMCLVDEPWAWMNEYKQFFIP